MNGPTHRLLAGIAVGVAAAHSEQANGQSTAMPLAAGAIGALCTNLPDWLEPATSPNHRKFFHSIVFATGVVVAFKKAWYWEPETGLERCLRVVVLAGMAGYLTHLALDATTKRSLPILGL